nr:ribonuclease H-like domain-containing protein [Tanacetum cinerariifolium]
LNSKITDLTNKLLDANNMIYHYKLALAQVESRLVEYKEREVIYIEKIRTLEYYNEGKKECIESLRKELKNLKKEKEVVDGKLAGLLTALKDLDNIIGSQRPSPTVESSSEEDQNRNPSASENVTLPITPKQFVKFVKASDSQSKSPDFVMKKKACFNCGDFNHLAYECRKGNFPTANKKFPTASRKFPTGSTKSPIANMGMKGKAVKPSACWTWKPSQNLSNKGPKNNSVSVMFKKYTYIDTQECIVLGRDFKLLDDANILLRTPRHHNMYSIDLKNIVPHGDLTCLVAKASADECNLWHRRLGKFDAKGDEGYFLGYSMSRKAFRVFNKRTKRVEENLHIEFLENKAIEKGSGLNWLFDIDSLTKSMNYVPVVDAGTNSTNFLSTKFDARKDVKKDVSSLRYIVLPNKVHEEHLESTSSQPQDACNTNTPESSGNLNPTATLTNPPANQLETLTVETPILA